MRNAEKNSEGDCPEWIVLGQLAGFELAQPKDFGAKDAEPFEVLMRRVQSPESTLRLPINECIEGFFSELAQLQEGCSAQKHLETACWEYPLFLRLMEELDEHINTDPCLFQTFPREFVLNLSSLEPQALYLLECTLDADERLGQLIKPGEALRNHQVAVAAGAILAKLAFVEKTPSILATLHPKFHPVSRALGPTALSLFTPSCFST